MKEIQKKFLHDIIAEILNLPLNKVIWAYQNGMPRQKTPYVLLRLYGMKSEAQEEIRETEIDDVKNIFVPQTINLEVQYFAGTTIKIDPSHELQKLVRGLENPLIVDKFFVERLAVFNHSQVIDITNLLESQIYEYRAAIDLNIRFSEENRVNLGAIEQVNINTQPTISGGDSSTISGGENSRITNSLIYGKIKNLSEIESVI